MPRLRDFRNYSYQASRIDRCGRDIGSKRYWKLYAIENTIRVIIHSVLNVQIGIQWWDNAVGPTIKGRARDVRARYAGKPQNANPGAHEIHLVFLGDLTEIIRSNSHLFTPVVPKTNQLIATLEEIRVPRNLVGHMNFPNAFDRHAIDNAYSQLPALLQDLRSRNVPIEVPR